MRDLDLKMAPPPNDRLFNATLLVLVRESASYDRSAHLAEAVAGCPYFFSLIQTKALPSLACLVFQTVPNSGGDAKPPIPLHRRVPNLLSTSSDLFHSTFSSSHTFTSDCSAWDANNTTKKAKFCNNFKCCQRYDPPPRIRFPRSPRPSPATCPS